MMTSLDALSSLAVRMSRNLDRSGTDGCWRWRRAMHPRGYAQIMLNGKVTTAPRATFYMVNGRLPLGRLWRTCPTRNCCSPSHFQEGKPLTRRHGGTKIPPTTIAAMRRERRKGLTWATIAELHGCHPATARRLVQGKRNRRA